MKLSDFQYLRIRHINMQFILRAFAAMKISNLVQGLLKLILITVFSQSVRYTNFSLIRKLTKISAILTLF